MTTSAAQKPATWLDRWHERVVAAQRAVADAEKALPGAVDPADQTRAFRDYEARKRELQIALGS